MVRGFVRVFLFLFVLLFVTLLPVAVSIAVVGRGEDGDNRRQLLVAICQQPNPTHSQPTTIIGIKVKSSTETTRREGKGREGKGREGKGREGKGRNEKGLKPTIDQSEGELGSIEMAFIPSKARRQAGNDATRLHARDRLPTSRLLRAFSKCR